MNNEEFIYYYSLCITSYFSIKELRKKIKSKEYYRLPKSIRNKLITNTKLELKDTIKDPIIINTDKNIINEKTLHHIILEDIPSFLTKLPKNGIICH